MYAGVGCHTNHPSKAKYDVPVIYTGTTVGEGLAQSYNYYT